MTRQALYYVPLITMLQHNVTFVRGYYIKYTIIYTCHRSPRVTQRKLPRRAHVERRFPIDESFMTGSSNAAHLKFSCSIRPRS